MTVRELMPQFLALGEAHAGCGPNHPDTPNPALRNRTDAFLVEHPALFDDPSYVDFLRLYSGATLLYPSEAEEDWVVFLPGLNEDDPDLVPFTTEGYGVGPDGLLMVAQMFYQPAARGELQFGYYMTGGQRPGLHRIARRGETESRCWYAVSFAAWLQHFLKLRDGMFEE
jgi:hypothetical protein